MWSHVLSCQWIFLDWLPNQSPLVMYPAWKLCHIWLKLSIKEISTELLLWRTLFQTEGTRRIIHKRRKWGELSVFGGRKEYTTWGVTAELSSKGIPFLVDSTRGENEEDSPISVDKRSPPQVESGVGFLAGYRNEL